MSADKLQVGQLVRWGGWWANVSGVEIGDDGSAVQVRLEFASIGPSGVVCVSERWLHRELFEAFVGAVPDVETVKEVSP